NLSAFVSLNHIVAPSTLPLLPSPTLFRPPSASRRPARDQRAPESVRSASSRRFCSAPYAAQSPRRSASCERVHASSARWAAAAGDRKSTRLNSSHGSISYAVFCLQKKTIPERQALGVLREDGEADLAGPAHPPQPGEPLQRDRGHGCDVRRLVPRRGGVQERGRER